MRSEVVLGRPAWWVSGIALAAGGCFAIGLGLLGLAMLIAACSVLLASVGSPARPRSALSCLPFAAVLVGVLVVTASMTAWLVHLDVLASPSRARGLLVLVCAGVGLLGWRWSASPVPLAGASQLVAVSPGLWVVYWGGRLLVRGPLAQLDWLFNGGDNLSHVLLTSGIQRVGHLSYGHEGYPRLLHAVAAQLASARGQSSVDVTGLVRTAETFAVLEWYAWALAVMASGLLAHALVRRFDETYAALAGLAVGVLLLGEHYFSFSLQYGFATSALLVLLLAAGSLELLERQLGSASAVVVAAVLLAAVSHTWQLALLPAGLAVLLALASWYPRRTACPWVVTAATTCFAVSVPPLVYVLVHVGVDGVALPGDVAALQRTHLIASLAVSALVGTAGVVGFARSRRSLTDLRWTLVAASPVLLGITAWLLARVAHTTTDSYFPRKLLWNATALGLCLVCAAFGLLAAGVSRVITQRQPRLRLLPVVPVLPLLLLVPGQAAHVRHAASSDWAHAAPVVQALSTPGVSKADTAWLLYPDSDTAVTDYRVEVLLGYWHLDRDSIPLPAAPKLALMTARERCRVFRQHDRLLVLSGEPVERLRAKAGCPDLPRHTVAVLRRVT